MSYKVNEELLKLRRELKQLNSIQYDKKCQLRKVIAFVARQEQILHRTAVKFPNGHPHQGATYVALNTMRYLMSGYRSISEITKDLNNRKIDIRMKEGYVHMIKSAVSKSAAFQGDKVGHIFVIHAHGSKGPNGEFHQEEIWANNYYLEDGKYRFRGGSMRVHGPFDVVVMDMIAEGHVKVEVKDEEYGT